MTEVSLAVTEVSSAVTEVSSVVTEVVTEVSLGEPRLADAAGGIRPHAPPPAPAIPAGTRPAAGGGGGGGGGEGGGAAVCEGGRTYRVPAARAPNLCVCVCVCVCVLVGAHGTNRCAPCVCL